MKKILTYKGAVMTWECDSNGHMNVMYYINKFEHGGRNFGLEMGLTDLGRNDELGIVVVEQTIKYLKEVFEDELLFIESSLLAVGNKTFTILHEMYNTKNKELVSTMNVILVLFDKINRKALPIPTDIKENLIKTLG
ncbi:MAG: thioesterase family protein [Bacteroidetes bacterium]|jgi:acyl-CoA thioester hydrolase|nr:thioesterase family protein [Bacteroidota bacterium]MDF1863336.1 thioesterase family protein [Saprospiraceae bacterium]